MKRIGLRYSVVLFLFFFCNVDSDAAQKNEIISSNFSLQLNCTFEQLNNNKTKLTVSLSDNPTLIINAIEISGSVNDVQIDNKIAYTASGYGGVHVLDFNVLFDIKIINKINIAGYADKIYVIDGIAYVSYDNNSGIQVINIENPLNPFTIKNLVLNNRKVLDLFNLDNDYDNKKNVFNSLTTEEDSIGFEYIHNSISSYFLSFYSNKFICNNINEWNRNIPFFSVSSYILNKSLHLKSPNSFNNPSRTKLLKNTYKDSKTINSSLTFCYKNNDHSFNDNFITIKKHNTVKPDPLRNYIKSYLSTYLDHTINQVRISFVIVDNLDVSMQNLDFKLSSIEKNKKMSENTENKNIAEYSDNITINKETNITKRFYKKLSNNPVSNTFAKSVKTGFGFCIAIFGATTANTKIIDKGLTMAKNNAMELVDVITYDIASVVIGQSSYLLTIPNDLKNISLHLIQTVPKIIDTVHHIIILRYGLFGGAGYGASFDEIGTVKHTFDYYLPINFFKVFFKKPLNDVDRANYEHDLFPNDWDWVENQWTFKETPRSSWIGGWLYKIAGTPLFFVTGYLQVIGIRHGY